MSPVLLSGHPLAVPHRCNPLMAFTQRAAGVLRPSVVHPHRTTFGLCRHLVAEEEHLAHPGHDLVSGFREHGVSALVRHRAVREARRDALTFSVRPAIALAVAMWAVLVVPVLVVDRVERLLPLALDEILVFGDLTSEGWGEQGGDQGRGGESTGVKREKCAEELGLRE